MNDVIIIGAGPAGLMCAYELEKHNINYRILEKNDIVGKKLLITGNGRCNVTNNRSVEEFIDDLTIENKKFLYSTLYTFGPDQVLDFLRSNGLEVVLEQNLKYFPKTSKAKSIIDIFMKVIKKSNIIFNTDVKDIYLENNYYTIKTSNGKFRAKNVVIATGSKSFPKTGSTGDGLSFAKSFNIKTKHFTPAETHVYSKQSVSDMGDVKGLSYKNVTVTIKDTNYQYTHDILFTHLGMSGPVIYHLSEVIYSEHKNGNKKILINFVNKDYDELLEELKESKEGLLQFLRKYVTKKHSIRILELIGVSKEKVSQLNHKEKEKITKYLTMYEVIIDRVEDVTKSYVNKGGIDTLEINPSSMEAKKQKNCYFIGEVIDVHGPIGGYNVTIAFGTGYLAALDIIEKVKENNNG